MFSCQTGAVPPNVPPSLSTEMMERVFQHLQKDPVLQQFGFQAPQVASQTNKEVLTPQIFRNGKWEPLKTQQCVYVPMPPAKKKEVVPLSTTSPGNPQHEHQEEETELLQSQGKEEEVTEEE